MSQARVSVELSIRRASTQQTDERCEIFERRYSLCRSETGKIKVVRVNSPTDFIRLNVEIKHRFVRGKLARVDRLLAAATLPLFSLLAIQEQTTDHQQSDFVPSRCDSVDAAGRNCS